MTQLILYTSDDGNSVINPWLTTAAARQNCRGGQSTTLAIGTLPVLSTPCRESRLPDFYAMFPNWNALRSELSWTHYRLLLGDVNAAATVKESLSVRAQNECRPRYMFHGLKRTEYRPRRLCHG